VVTQVDDDDNTIDRTLAVAPATYTSITAAAPAPTTGSSGFSLYGTVVQMFRVLRPLSSALKLPLRLSSTPPHGEIHCTISLCRSPASSFLSSLSHSSVIQEKLSIIRCKESELRGLWDEVTKVC
jgi:hypothetical protein